VAKSALRHLPFADLTARDAPLAGACGAPWAAACPALPASRRPARDRFEVRCHLSTGRESRFAYPSRLSVLTDAAFDEAPGWTVELPNTPGEVERNARLMRNCTEGFAEAIEDGSAYLVIVSDPQGRRYNVGLMRDGQGFVIGEINSWGNGGVEPAWIRAAFRSRLTRSYIQDTTGDDPPIPARRPSDRRDRRRSRSRSPRRLKR